MKSSSQTVRDAGIVVAFGVCIISLTGCADPTPESMWVSAIITGESCAQTGRDAKRIIGTKNITPESRYTCYEAAFIGESELTDYLRLSSISPLETQCGIIRTGPPQGITPFLPDRAYHFKVTVEQAQAMIDSGGFTSKEYYDQTEIFFELPCHTFGLIPKP